jgi:hypothetical protein
MEEEKFLLDEGEKKVLMEELKIYFFKCMSKIPSSLVSFSNHMSTGLTPGVYPLFPPFFWTCQSIPM